MRGTRHTHTHQHCQRPEEQARSLLLWRMLFESGEAAPHRSGLKRKWTTLRARALKKVPPVYLFYAPSIICDPRAIPFSPFPQQNRWRLLRICCAKRCLNCQESAHRRVEEGSRGCGRPESKAHLYCREFGLGPLT